MSNVGGVRTSQLVTTYGVGAMVAAGNESFIVAGLDRWEVSHEDELGEPRLEKMLGVHSFRRPPSSPDTDARDVPVRRFPRYHSCPACNELADVSRFESTFGKALCGKCDDEPLNPSRFVMACADGHLDDFPYFQWAHKDEDHTGSSGKLTLVTKGESAGLADVVIKCACGATQTMEGAFSKGALMGVRRCTGARPWLGKGSAESCDQIPRTLQRGASNVWFSATASAISIPPWSQAAFRLLDRCWSTLKHVPAVALAATIEGMELANDDTPLEQLIAAAMERKRKEDGDVEPTDLKTDEYEALVRGAPERGGDEFVSIPAPVDADPAVGDLMTSVMQVPRLREVRALVGFSRLQPAGIDDSEPARDPGDSAPKLVSIRSEDVNWLPAIEVLGEGVFLEFGSQLLQSWENRPEVTTRVSRLAESARSSSQTPVTPRLVLLHTIAHLLMDQWALDSGYSSSALAERLYVQGDQAGVLIYTATSDSAGSLGGVVAMTEGGRLGASLREAVRRASWCSSDPLCIEAGTQGADALNLAACHACCLVPETSCELRNQFLDRALVVGTPEQPDIGFLHHLA